MNKITKLMVGTSLLAASVAASAWNFGGDSWSWGKDYSYNSGSYSNSWGSARNGWGANRWGGNNAPWNWGNNNNRRYYGGPGAYGPGPGYGASGPMYGPGPGSDFDPAANPYINPPPAPEAPVLEQPAAHQQPRLQKLHLRTNYSDSIGRIPSPIGRGKKGEGLLKQLPNQ